MRNLLVHNAVHELHSFCGVLASRDCRGARGPLRVLCVEVGHAG